MTLPPAIFLSVRSHSKLNIFTFKHPLTLYPTQSFTDFRMIILPESVIYDGNNIFSISHTIYVLPLRYDVSGRSYALAAR